MGKKQQWRPMKLVYVGRVAEALRAGGGKLSPTFDGGDSRKAPGQN